MLNFELGPIRPPDEAKSLLIRTTRSCPWNKCNFCTLFKGQNFSIRNVEDIKKDIYAAKEYYKNSFHEECFLQDGDSFAMKTKDLIEVLNTIKECFPTIKQISSYGRAQSLTRKSFDELQSIKNAGLNMLYCGMESGSDLVLKLHNKGTTSKNIIESSIKAKSAGMNIRLFIILGLGGKELSQSHIQETANVLNSINPKDIRILTLAVKEGTKLNNLMSTGQFTPLTEFEMAEEQKKLISLLLNVSGKYGNYHGINLFTELNGKLPEDRDKFINTLDKFLNLDFYDQNNYILGKRLGYYRTFNDLNKPSIYKLVSKQLDELIKNKSDLEKIYHKFRSNWI